MEEKIINHHHRFISVRLLIKQGVNNSSTMHLDHGFQHQAPEIEEQFVKGCLLLQFTLLPDQTTSLKIQQGICKPPSLASSLKGL